MLAILATFAPMCVLGKVIIEPARMNKVVVNIADDRTKKMVTKMPPNPDGGFMMFLDPGVYRMRLVGLHGEAIGPLRVLKVEEGKLTRVCVPSRPVATVLGRLEGVVNVSPINPVAKAGQVEIPPMGMFKGCTVTATPANGKPVKVSAAPHGIFTADLNPGEYTLTTDYKSPRPADPVKVTIKAGSLASARIEVDSGIR